MRASFSPPRLPATRAELLERARALCGLTVGELAARMDLTLPRRPASAKGLVGQMVERALGGTGGNLDVPDFPHLGVELKTVPLDARGRVQESTYICFLDLRRMQSEEWETSRVRRKLACVLWLPVQASGTVPLANRRLGLALLWQPDAKQEALLRGDWMELVGLIAVGGIEEVSAHLGRALQVRPKARDGRVRVEVQGHEGEVLDTVPLGFYLRAAFTQDLLDRAAGRRDQRL